MLLVWRCGWRVAERVVELCYRRRLAMGSGSAGGSLVSYIGSRLATVGAHGLGLSVKVEGDSEQALVERS